VTTVRINRERLWRNLVQLKEPGSASRSTARPPTPARRPPRPAVDAGLAAAEVVDDVARRHGVVATWERMAKTAMVPFHRE
jgi:hypothetical protein